MAVSVCVATCVFALMASLFCAIIRISFSDSLLLSALASTLQLTGVIDDSISVGRALRRGAPRCAFRLIAQPWNQTEQVERGRRHLRVQTVHTALDDLLGAENWGASSACTQPTRQ